MPTVTSLLNSFTIWHSCAKCEIHRMETRGRTQRCGRVSCTKFTLLSAAGLGRNPRRGGRYHIFASCKIPDGLLSSTSTILEQGEGDISPRVVVSVHAKVANRERQPSKEPNSDTRLTDRQNGACWMRHQRKVCGFVCEILCTCVQHVGMVRLTTLEFPVPSVSAHSASGQTFSLCLPPPSL